MATRLSAKRRSSSSSCLLPCLHGARGWTSPCKPCCAEHAGKHGNDENDGLRRQRHEAGNSGTRAKSRQSPSQAEEGRAPDQPCVQIPCGRKMKSVCKQGRTMLQDQPITDESDRQCRG